MKKAYYAPIIEFEAGWGSKVDGYLVCLDREVYTKAKEVIEKGDNPELFWRVEEPKLCIIKDEIEIAHGSYLWLNSSKSAWLLEE